jgi:hypothetical protein
MTDKHGVWLVAPQKIPFNTPLMLQNGQAAAPISI